MGCSKHAGRVVLFTDADLSSPYRGIREASGGHSRRAATWPSASRAMDRTLIKVHQSRLREIAGIIFNGFVRLFTGSVRFRTPSAGSRPSCASARPLFSSSSVLSASVSIPKILFLAKRHGLRVAEVPVRWAARRGHACDAWCATACRCSGTFFLSAGIGSWVVIRGNPRML